MDLPEDIYILIAEHDASEKTRDSHPEWDSQPIIMESPLCNTTREAALKLATKWRGLGYGEVLIGRLVISDIDQINPLPTAGDLLLADNNKIAELLSSLSADEWEAFSPELQSHLKLIVLEWIRNL